ncbi:peptidoglycan-binding domain-containing protein (plasmid) [Paraclostridium bifermentans]|uniref:Peptidoglycan-binding domain-containing protein n=1 Tax=Paraclostridium bifermentans TaxID=1490 RepID=A0ABY8R8K1_PARBF|nr:peptidoglycan-binding domain-containing protein [Paraclostridium bifermentans]
MKKRKLAIALAGVTISTSMFFTGKVFADTPEAASTTSESSISQESVPTLRAQNGYTVSISGERINLYRYGSFVSYFTYTNSENIVGYGHVTSGNQVLAAQAMLSFCATGCGIGKDINTDGVLGAATVEQIKAVQRDYGIAADGIIGPNTWRALTKYWR